MLLIFIGVVNIFNVVWILGVLCGAKLTGN